jgi:hypothetical protein
LIAGDAYQFAAAKRETRRRQQQEELPEIQSFERSVEAQPCAGLRYIDHHAVPPPGSIDPHDENGDAAFKPDTPAFSVPIGHPPNLTFQKI